MDFLKLIRYKNLLMVLLTMILTKYALIKSFLKETYLSHLDFTLLALSVVLITAGGYIINDIFDVEADKINKPNTIFIDVTISKKNAWKTYYLLTLLGLIFGVYLSFNKQLPYHSFYFLFTIIGLYFYSKNLKRKVLLGNLLVSILCVFVIYLVFSYDFRIDNNDDELFAIRIDIIFVFTYIIFSFLTTFIREIIKDIEDINGDLKLKAKTLPIVIGRKRAAKVAFFCSSLLLFFLIIVIQFLQDNYLFLVFGIVFLIFPTINFMSKLWTAKTKKDFSKLSNLMKVIMLFGILSMLLFTIN